MAEKRNNNEISKGSEHLVTVEEGGTDIIVVRLEYSGTIYRGALLNITNRSAPCGVNVLRLQSNIWTYTEPTVPASEEGKQRPIEDSASVNRFSYKNEPLEPLPPNLPSMWNKPAKRSYKEKTVRNIRLRPRQVLCANCKSSCSDNQENKKKTNLSLSNETAKVELPPPSIPLKINLKKSCSTKDSVPKSPRQIKSVIHKTSPIIKISFNNPEGQGTVVSIPRKTKNSQDNDVGDTSNSTSQESLNWESVSRKIKKSVKKAKDRFEPYDSHARHGKHKKHKHKHDKKLSEGVIPVVALSPLNLKNYTTEDCDSEEKAAADDAMRSPLRTKVIMKRERSASGSLNYVYQAQRVSGTTGSSSTNKRLTLKLNRLEEDRDDDKTDEENIGPLMMRIQTKSVNKVMLEDQRTICNGDIVWGKIHGFPWWPGKVESIKIGQKADGSIIYQQAHVSWFGSSTRSDMECSELYNFLEDFELKFNKKKRGPYRVAIKEATRQAQGLAAITEESLTENLLANSGEVEPDLEVEERTSLSPFCTDDAAILAPVSPHTPQLPLSPHTPQLPVSPHTPQLPVSPHTPQLPVSPHTPQLPVSPHTQQLPVSPHTPQLPVSPHTPQLPVSPHTPQLPVSPYTPQLPCTSVSTHALSDMAVCASPRTPPLFPIQTHTQGIYPNNQPYQSQISPKSPISLSSIRYSPISTSSDSPKLSPKYSPTSPNTPNSPSPMTSSRSVTSFQSPRYSAVLMTSPHYSMTSPARTPSSPKPLGRYSPKYSPVTPTPSPLHSPVIASPMQCV